MSPDSEKSVTEVVQPVVVSVIGGTGDGGLKQDTVATTPGSQPNLVVQVVTPIVAVAVRFINTYLVTLSGLIVAGGVLTKAIPAGDFIALVKVCGGLSLGVAGVGLIKDLATVFSGLEKRFPLASGSV